MRKSWIFAVVMAFVTTQAFAVAGAGGVDRSASDKKSGSATSTQDAGTQR